MVGEEAQPSANNGKSFEKAVTPYINLAWQNKGLELFVVLMRGPRWLLRCVLMTLDVTSSLVAGNRRYKTERLDP